MVPALARRNVLSKAMGYAQFRLQRLGQRVILADGHEAEVGFTPGWGGWYGGPGWDGGWDNGWHGGHGDWEGGD
jgi:hypothetical protein